MCGVLFKTTIDACVGERQRERVQASGVKLCARARHPNGYRRGPMQIQRHQHQELQLQRSFASTNAAGRRF
jgi:hypothetical protein